MISKLTLIFMIISAAITFLLPVVLTIFVARKHKKILVAVISGALSFFILQVMIRIPLLQLTAKIEIKTNLAIIIYLFFLAFTAALFETVGRYIFIILLLKKDYRFGTGLAHGIGHGGIEAIVLVGINYITYVIFALLVNSGNLATITDALPDDLAAQIILLRDTLINTESYLFLIAGFERVFTIFLHIALSVLMMYGFKQSKHFYFLIVFGIHFLIDFIVGIISTFNGNVILAEVFMLIMAVLAIVTIGIFKRKFNENSIEIETETI